MIAVSRLLSVVSAMRRPCGLNRRYVVTTHSQAAAAKKGAQKS